MKRCACVMLLLCVFMGTQEVYAQLKIDFTTTGGAVESGFQGYFADNEVPSTFSAQSFSAFGTTITITPTWAAGASATAMEMIDRGGDDGFERPDLLRDWIGTDTRQPGNPLTLTISGLPAGKYSWLSYHADGQDQTGIFSVTVNDATGSTTTDGIDISDTNSGLKTMDQITTFSTEIVSRGEDITLVFNQTSASDPVNFAFFVMNGFELDLISSINKAEGPHPNNGEQDVALDTNLTWTAGLYAVTHDVYFGTDFNDVNDASRTDPRGVLVSQDQSDTGYTPSGLALDQTYYWRVDEVNKPSDNKIYKGTTWSFTAEPTYLPVVPTTAIASSNEVGSGPEKTIDGSGLNDMDQHSTDVADMWLNSGDDPNGTWIQYNFDTAYKLSKMLVWNCNQNFESVLGMGVKDANVEISLDGVNWTNVAGDPLQFAQGTGLPTYTANTTVDLGDTMAKFVRINVLSHWSFLPTVTQFSLSEVRFMAIPAAARRPEPASGSSLASLTDQLVWRAGRGAEQHQLYIDTNEAQVAAGDAGALVSTQADRRYDLGNTNLLYDEKYYWKVDENDGNEVVASPVWDFSTPPYLIVDNMDSYNDTDNLIYDAWVDGYNDNTNGSQVGYLQAPFAEQSIVFAGQSMPFSYNNTGSVTQSTATLDLGGQDWSRGGAQTLVFYFLGELDNDDATLFVKVNNSPEVDCTSSLSAGLWTQENIDLAALGTDLSNVKTLTIGVKGAGSGMLYIDEIRVYREAPAVVTPTDPGNAGLVLDYEMDNSTADSSGNGLDGTVQGAPLYFASRTTDMGQALQFDGLENYVDVPIGNQITGWTDCSISAWVNIDPTSTGSWQRVFDFGTDTTNYMFLSPRTGTNGPVRAAILDPNANGGNEYGVTSSSELTDGWHHVACVFTSGDPNGTLTLYVDGWSAGTVETSIYPKDLGVTTQNWLGQSQWSADSLLMGLLDQFRIYNRALTAGEIRFLAGDR